MASVAARASAILGGEGYLGRHHPARGASRVVGVDLERPDRRRAAAQTLSVSSIGGRCTGARLAWSGSFDLVVSQLAPMDMADHARVFGAVRRVLKPGGAFLFSVLHPCFEGTPFHAEREPRYVVDGDGTPTAFAVRRYATEGYWKSGGDGARGRMGAYHRMLSSYVNDLIEAGFAIERSASRSSRAAGCSPRCQPSCSCSPSRREARRPGPARSGQSSARNPLVEPLCRPEPHGVICAWFVKSRAKGHLAAAGGRW